ncbi:MAG: hemolysin III family protein [Polyangiaceae bacterium]
MTDASATTDKPLLRGVSHQIFAVVAVVATAFLVLRAKTPDSRFAAMVFGASLTMLLAVSALYHRVNWGTKGRARMRRVDHAAIFLLIAGGYTPLLWLVPPTEAGHRVLLFIWIGAAIGVVKSVAWVHAPKWLTALLCLGLGWAGVTDVVERMTKLEPIVTPLIVAAGVLYTAGAATYALKRPDPFPKVFGYHEVFHALVVLASACLFVHVALLVGTY